MNKKIADLFILMISLTIVIPTCQAIVMDKNQYNISYLEGPTSPIISGPEEGITGTIYNFTLVSTDSSGFNLSYYIEWGDGNVEEWIGPYVSGVSLNISHIWEEWGTFTIKAKARNSNGTESEWSEGHNITITADVKLKIGEIVGGLLGVTAVINNTGTHEATGVVGSMIVEGGTMFIGQEISENIGTIDPGNYSGVYNIPMLGFGSIEITITAKCNEVGQVKKTITGFIILIYVIIH